MKKQHIKLTETDERYLTTLLSRGQLPARVFRRAGGLLQLHQGASFQSVAQTFQIVPQTVSRWCAAYLETGLEFLDDQKRTGRPIDGFSLLGCPARLCQMEFAIARRQSRRT